MPRLEKVTPYSGDAAHGSEAIENPLSLISRPLYLDPYGQPDADLQRWEMPHNDRVDGLAVDFERHRKADPIVVIGGFDFLAALGVIPRWLVHDATRDDAVELLKNRGQEALLESLSLPGREGPFDLFSKTSIHNWFKHSPDVNREGGFSKKEQKSRKGIQYTLSVRKKHPLRLRKAIDLITLIEAALKYRYDTGKTRNRTAYYTGIDADNVYPEIVWDVLWLEPIHYVMSSPPVGNHIQTILDKPGVEDRFRAECGNGIGALYWTMKGAPGKFRTIQAACNICNEIYGDAFPPSVVTTAKPGQYRNLMGLFDDKKVPSNYKKTIGFAPEFGPYLKIHNDSRKDEKDPNDPDSVPGTQRPGPFLE